MSDENPEPRKGGPVLDREPAHLFEAIEGPGDSREGKAIMLAAQILKQHSGPLPDPDTLAAYERILPGAAERIVSQFEKQLAHRMMMEREIVHSDTFSQAWSTISGSIIALSSVIGSLLLAWTGHYVSGLSVFFGTLFTFLGTFVAGKRVQSAEFDAKPKQQLLNHSKPADPSASATDRS